jgi:hypothetical protein
VYVIATHLGVSRAVFLPPDSVAFSGEGPAASPLLSTKAIMRRQWPVAMKAWGNCNVGA